MCRSVPGRLAAVPLALTESHLLDSDRLRNTSQRGGLKSPVIGSKIGGMCDRADGGTEASCRASAKASSANGVVGTSGCAVDTEVVSAGTLGRAVDLRIDVSQAHIELQVQEERKSRLTSGCGVPELL